MEHENTYREKSEWFPLRYIEGYKKGKEYKIGDIVEVYRKKYKILSIVR